MCHSWRLSLDRGPRWGFDTRIAIKGTLSSVILYGPSKYLFLMNLVFWGHKLLI